MGISVFNTPLPEYVQDEYNTLLEACGLRDESDADLVAFMTDDSGRLIACGALAGHTIKQLAVLPEAEGQGIMAAIISQLISEAAVRGEFRLFLCTKPTNAQMFGSLGFYEVVSTPEAVLMENRRGGAERFISSIPKREGVCGAVVCNCDPFTLGHRRLIEHAAANCDSLYVFAVSERGSMFSSEDRLRMIRKGTEDIPNCYVYESDLYLISRATFPAYFIKDQVQAEAVKADIDIEFFAGHLAPALNITKRFVGQEPIDQVTRAYNERMKELLPQRGISLEEIPRLADSDGLAVSASRVRNLIRQARSLAADKMQEINPKAESANAEELQVVIQQIRSLVPDTTFDIIMRLI